MPKSMSNWKVTAARFRNPAWVCFTWFGVTLGMSLLAVPAIFQADSVDRAGALDVAREVFLMLGRVELGLLVLLLVLIRVTGRSAVLWVPAALLALIVIVQNAWLVPELAARTDMIVDGREPPPSMAHAAYSISGLVKLVLLLGTGVATLPSLARGNT